MTYKSPLRTGPVSPRIGRFKKAKAKPGRREAWEIKALAKIIIPTPRTHPHLFR